ncbi:hypothetical protein [Mycolicibacterium stellerae]|uniref:hypothetical protein n=1 Tax=Mycolicibacterium stellerae TaxID=2358193 RepID=UPI001F429EF4|nr:hypothetical protein [Mycolicibacterium stellerae]
MGQPPVPVQQTNRWSQWFARLTSAQTRRIALLLVLAATAAFGGLQTVDTQVTPFKPGEEFSDGEFMVTIDRARLVDELKGTYGTAKPGKVYLGVVATLRNDGTVPGRLRDQLDLREVSGGEFFGAFRYRDGSAIQTLGPGLTEQLVFAWLLPDSAAASLESVTIRVWKKQYTQLMVVGSTKEWMDTDNYGQVVVPVKESA